LVAVLPILVARHLGLFILGSCWMFIRANSLMTLPVEHNATSRVLDLIHRFRVIAVGPELSQLELMLRAAELDKVSGFLKTFHFLASHLIFWRRR
jgi:Zn-dependent membrane protease YugP